MKQVFFDMLDKNMIVYLDDILIFTKSEEEHRRVLTEVFRHLAKYSLFAKKNNCALFLMQVEFLGHIIMTEGISIQAGKIDAVEKWPQPKTVTELQQFLGLCNYYCRLFQDMLRQPHRSLIYYGENHLQYNLILLRFRLSRNLKTA